VVGIITKIAGSSDRDTGKKLPHKRRLPIRHFFRKPERDAPCHFDRRAENRENLMRDPARQYGAGYPGYGSHFDRPEER